MAKSSKGDISDKDILDVTLAWFMHCNFKAAETGLMSQICHKIFLLEASFMIKRGGGP